MHTGFSNLDSFLDKYDKFIISSHESPDWDGLGSSVAFRELLENLGKTAMILISDPPPATFGMIDTAGIVQILSEATVLPDDIGEYAHFILDTNDYQNIGAAYHLLKDKVRDVFIIDHHEGGEDKFEKNFIMVEASSVCEIVYQIIHYYEKPISKTAAEALFAGIVFDTGSFRYPKTSPETFQMAAHLVELGVIPNWIYEIIYEHNTLSSFTLRSLILSSMEVFFDGRMIAMKLTPEMLRQSGATFAEGELIINTPLTIRGVVASILVKQDLAGPVKVSMRTKGNYDVAAIAMANGGGGHKNAAGYKSAQSFSETYKRVVEDIGLFFVKSGKI